MIAHTHTHPHPHPHKTNMSSLLAQQDNRPSFSPQYRILKRDKSNDMKPDMKRTNTEAELKKTLKLREAEYKAARNRILGENYDKPGKSSSPSSSSLSFGGTTASEGGTKISIIKRPSCFSYTTTTATTNSSGENGGSHVESVASIMPVLQDRNLVGLSNSIWKPPPTSELVCKYSEEKK